MYSLTILGELEECICKNRLANSILRFNFRVYIRISTKRCIGEGKTVRLGIFQMLQRDDCYNS
jgi:hypothetical protein